MKTSKATLALVSFAALATAIPVRAADRCPIDFTVWGSFIHNSSSTITDPAFGVGINIADGAGAGLTTNVGLGTVLSAEVGAFFYRQSAEIVAGTQRIVGAGRLDSVPLHFIVQAHPNGRGDVDPYVGIGVAYQLFGNLHSSELDAAGIGVVAVTNKAALAAQVGLRWATSPHCGVLIDAKYVPLKATSQAAQGAPLDLQLDPFRISLGLGFRF